MKLLSIVSILFFSISNLFGQSNTADINAALELLCDSPAAEPFFQVDTDEGISMVLVYQEVRTRNQGIPISETLKAIRYELSTNFYCPIVILSQAEYNQMGLRNRPETELRYRIFKDQMNLILTTQLISNAESYTVDYRLEKKFNGWEIVNQNVISTRR